MGLINIPHEEREALKGIDSDILDQLIELSLGQRIFAPLRALGLESCGLYVASRLRAFETAIAEYGAAKASKMLTESGNRARRAGTDLAHAVLQMKRKVEEGEREDQLFYIDDLIQPPNNFGSHLSVRVRYRWRATIDDKWEHGSITFTHDVDLRPDYSMPLSKRKLSASERDRDRQERLYGEWEHLMQLGLYSVSDFLRRGGDASAIPESFQARADSYSRNLNNFSTQFWAAQ